MGGRSLRGQGRAPAARGRRAFLGGALALAALPALACRQEPPPQPPPATPPREILGAGDELDIRVFDEKRFDGVYEVQADGTIDFPYLGDVELGGRTPAEAAKVLEARLADGYLLRPQVTVTIKTRENREVSVLGQVNEPGSFPFQERLTLVQAVSLAGGLTQFAAPRRVRISRRTGAGDATETFEVSLKAIVDGDAEDLILRPGDIVFVPESRI
ncbi:MAG: polysaccharide export protein [Myxococcales bacterium]|nr:polysaccharide export protein [Myxococcales bacterium]MCB9704048.1 polysaccharide export protein [Myxococcales bacterium]